MAPLDCLSRLPADHNVVAAEYEALKRDLAQQHHFDREAYTAAKRVFITRVIDAPLAEGYGT